MRLTERAMRKISRAVVDIMHGHGHLAEQHKADQQEATQGGTHSHSAVTLSQPIRRSKRLLADVPFTSPYADY